MACASDATNDEAHWTAPAGAEAAEAEEADELAEAAAPRDEAGVGATLADTGVATAAAAAADTDSVPVAPTARVAAARESCDGGGGSCVGAPTWRAASNSSPNVCGLPS